MRSALPTIVISCDARCCWPKMQYHSTIQPHPQTLKCGMQQMHIGQPSHPHLDQKIYQKHRIDVTIHVRLRWKPRQPLIATMINRVRSNRAATEDRRKVVMMEVPSSVSFNVLNSQQLFQVFLISNPGLIRIKKSRRVPKAMKTMEKMMAIWRIQMMNHWLIRYYHQVNGKNVSLPSLSERRPTVKRTI